MEQYVSLRQLHPIACQVKEKWRECNSILAIMVVSSDDDVYNAKQGDCVSPSEGYDGAVAIDVYAFVGKKYDSLPEGFVITGDRLLVISGSNAEPFSRVIYHHYCLVIVHNAYVLDVVDLSSQPTIQEVHR